MFYTDTQEGGGAWTQWEEPADGAEPDGTDALEDANVHTQCKCTNTHTHHTHMGLLVYLYCV